MVTDARCSDCGAEISLGVPEGLCANCLFLLGLKSRDGSAHSNQADLGPILAKPHSALGVKFHCFGDYELLEEIARGGMGLVFRARQVNLNRLVALKLILGGRVASPAIVKRFQVEAEAAAGLRHPHIVAVYEIGELQGHHYYSMEFVDGTGLDRKIATYKVPSVKALKSEDRSVAQRNQTRLARLMVSIASAVDYAHQHGVLHRDLKPSNILIDRQGEPHLADFGLAKVVDRDITQFTLSGAVMGTPSYMAPELVSGNAKQATTAADIYSLGAILYELLTGSPPFRGETPVEIWRRVMEEEPKPPTAVNNLVDQDLATICLKCLEKEPQRRYGSARALAEDLQRWLKMEPIPARPVSAGERLWRWGRREPLLAAFAASTLALLLAGFIGVSTQWRRAERAARISEQNLYAADMGLVQQTLREGNLGRARQLLDAHRPLPGQEDLRRFEWRLFRKLALGDHLAALAAHSNTVRWIAFSPDGKILVTASVDSTVKVWDFDQRRLLRTLHGHTGTVNCVAFTPDGSRLATASEDGSVKLWNTATWQVTNQLAGRPRHVAFSPAEPLLAYSEGGSHLTSSGRVTLWNYVTGERAARLPAAGCRFAFSPDGKTLVSGADGPITVWDLATQRSLWTTNQKASVLWLAVSPDGTKFANCNFGGGVRVFDLASLGRSLALRGHNARIWSVAFSPDGTQLAGGSSDQMIHLWDVSSWEGAGLPLRTLRGHGGEVHCLSFSPDGRFLASGDKTGVVLLWDLKSPSSEQLISNVLVAYTNPPPIFSRDGHLMAAVSAVSQVTVWNLNTLQSVQTFDGAMIPLSISADRQTLAAAGPDYAFQLWDIPSGRLRHTAQFVQPKYAFRATLSPDETILAVGKADGSFELWDTRTGKELWQCKGHKGSIRQLTFSPDSRLLASASADFSAKLWDMDARQELAKLSGHTDGVFSVAFSPDGRMIATGSIDGTARLWDVGTRRLLSILAAHKEGVFYVAFARDGQTLATASGDRTLRLWNLLTKREVARLDHHRDVVTAGFTPNGEALISSTLGGTIHRWSAPSFAELDVLEREKSE